MELNGGINYTVCNCGSILSTTNDSNDINGFMPNHNRLRYTNIGYTTSIPCYYTGDSSTILYSGGYAKSSYNGSTKYYPAISTYDIRYIVLMVYNVI